MHKINFYVIAAGLILAASAGGWVASTTAHERPVNVEKYRGGTPVRPHADPRSPEKTSEKLPLRSSA